MTRSALLLVVLLLGLPSMLQAQFECKTNAGTITITRYIGPGTNFKDQETAVTVPSAINGLPVTDIGRSAFLGCSKVTKVVLPESVTNIGPVAFAQGGLASVTIPHGVRVIRDHAFNNSRLLHIELPDAITSIEDWAFGQNTRLPSITIPASVTNIGSKAFYSCYSLTQVTIPSHVCRIGPGAFMGCVLIKEYVVEAASATYTTADGVLFDKAQSTLVAYPGAKTGDSYTVPDTVRTIGEGSFAYVSNIHKIIVPASVTNIDPGAFNDCRNLVDIYFQGNAPRIGKGVFNGNCKATVHYRANATGWAATFGDRPTVVWDGAIATPVVAAVVAMPTNSFVHAWREFPLGSTVCFDNAEAWGARPATKWRSRCCSTELDFSGNCLLKYEQEKDGRWEFKTWCYFVCETDLVLVPEANGMSVVGKPVSETVTVGTREYACQKTTYTKKDPVGNVVRIIFWQSPDAKFLCRSLWTLGGGPTWLVPSDAVKARSEVLKPDGTLLVVESAITQCDAPINVGKRTVVCLAEMDTDLQNAAGANEMRVCSTTKRWLSPDIPGRVVKYEFKDGIPGHVITTVATDVMIGDKK